MTRNTIFLLSTRLARARLSGSLIPGSEDPDFRKEKVKAKHLGVLEFDFLLQVCSVSCRKHKEGDPNTSMSGGLKEIDNKLRRGTLPRRRGLSSPWDLTC